MAHRLQTRSTVAVDASTSGRDRCDRVDGDRGPACGLRRLSSARGHRYVMQRVSWGRILTRTTRVGGAARAASNGRSRSRPLYRQYEPRRTYGFGHDALRWRWNFEPRGPLAPFVRARWRRAVDRRSGARPHRPPRTSPRTRPAASAFSCGRTRRRPRLSLPPHLERQSPRRNPGVNAHVPAGRLVALRAP